MPKMDHKSTIQHSILKTHPKKKEDKVLEKWENYISKEMIDQQSLSSQSISKETDLRWMFMISKSLKQDKILKLGKKWLIGPES